MVFHEGQFEGCSRCGNPQMHDGGRGGFFQELIFRPQPGPLLRDAALVYSRDDLCGMWIFVHDLQYLNFDDGFNSKYPSLSCFSNQAHGVLTTPIL